MLKQREILQQEITQKRRKKSQEKDLNPMIPHKLHLQIHHHKRRSPEKSLNHLTGQRRQKIKGQII